VLLKKRPFQESPFLRRYIEMNEILEVKCAADLMISLDEYPHIPHWFTLKQAIV